MPKRFEIHIATKLLLACVMLGCALALLSILNAEPAGLEELALRKF